MNLQDFDMLPALDDYSKVVVIHEFGHALGLVHEHQSSGSPCDGEFNLPAVKQLTGWNDQQIKTNFAMLEKDRGLHLGTVRPHVGHDVLATRTGLLQRHGKQVLGEAGLSDLV